MESRRQRVTNVMHLCVMSHGVRILSIIAVSREFALMSLWSSWWVQKLTSYSLTATCQKYYCENCVNVWNCKLCEKVSCAKCEEVGSICHNCYTPFCEECEEKAKYCIECGTSCCVECDENAGYCQVCDCKICYGCGFESFQCAHCPEMHKICVSCLFADY